MKFHIPGADIPDVIYKRMKNTNDTNKEGFDISLELINEIKKIRGVSGIHITALFWENIIPNLVEKARLF